MPTRKLLRNYEARYRNQLLEDVLPGVAEPVEA